MRPSILLVPKQVPSSAPKPSRSIHERLVEELGRYTSEAVAIREDTPLSDTGDVFLLVPSNAPSDWMRSLPDDARRSTLARVMLLQCHRAPRMFDTLESERLAGGVEYLRFTTWERRPEHDSGYGVAGLRDVVPRLGGECAEEPFASPHYCIYKSRTARSLPQAIAEYLSALSDVFLSGEPVL